MLIATAVLVSTLVVGAGEEPPPVTRVEAGKLTGFQKTTWGMSLAEVTKLFPKGRKLVEKARTKLYVDQAVAELDALVVYDFDAGKLVTVNVTFSDKQKGFAKPEQICDAVGRALREKYGDTKAVVFSSMSLSRWASESTNLSYQCMTFPPAFIIYADRRFEEASGRKVKGDDL